MTSGGYRATADLGDARLRSKAQRAARRAARGLGPSGPGEVQLQRATVDPTPDLPRHQRKLFETVLPDGTRLTTYVDVAFPQGDAGAAPTPPVARPSPEPDAPPPPAPVQPAREVPLFARYPMPGHDAR